MPDNNNNMEGQKPSTLTESTKPSILDFGQPDKEQSIIKVIGVGKASMMCRLCSATPTRRP